MPFCQVVARVLALAASRLVVLAAAPRHPLAAARGGGLQHRHCGPQGGGLQSAECRMQSAGSLESAEGRISRKKGLFCGVHGYSLAGLPYPRLNHL